MAGIAKLDMNRVTQDITMHVKVVGVKQYRVRAWVGVKLMTLAARIIGCRVEIGFGNLHYEETHV